MLIVTRFHSPDLQVGVKMISPINFRGFSPFFWIDWMNKNLGFQFVPPLQGDLKIRGTVFFDVAGFQPGGGHLI